MNICLGALLSCRSSELPMTVDAFVTGKMAPLRPRGTASLDIKGENELEAGSKAFGRVSGSGEVQAQECTQGDVDRRDKPRA